MTQTPGPVLEALQKCHQSAAQVQGNPAGIVRVWGKQAVHIPGGVIKLVASTCTDQFSGQSVLFEPPESGLPAGLLPSACLMQVVQGTVYVPVVNVVTTEALLYPRTGLGVLSAAQVITLPAGVTDFELLDLSPLLL